MTVEKVREFYYAEPFQPFLIHLSDGRQFAVEDPFNLGIAPSGRSLIVAGPDDAFDFIEMTLVTDLTVKPTVRRPAKRRKASGG